MTDESHDEQFMAPCKTCGCSTQHEVLATAPDLPAALHRRYAEPELDEAEVHEILRCRACRAIRFRSTFLYDDNGEPLEDGPQVRVLPAPDVVPACEQVKRELAFVRPQSNLPDLPDQVLNLEREVEFAFKCGLNTLCAAGIRAVLEGYAKAKGVAGNGIKAKIDELVSRGLISKPQAEALNLIRFMGNEAIHDLDVISSEELGLAMDSLEHVKHALFGLEVHTFWHERHRALRRGH